MQQSLKTSRKLLSLKGSWDKTSKAASLGRVTHNMRPNGLPPDTPTPRPARRRDAHVSVFPATRQIILMKGSCFIFIAVHLLHSFCFCKLTWNSLLRRSFPPRNARRQGRKRLLHDGHREGSDGRNNINQNIKDSRGNILPYIFVARLQVSWLQGISVYFTNLWINDNILSSKTFPERTLFTFLIYLRKRQDVSPYTCAGLREHMCQVIACLQWWENRCYVTMFQQIKKLKKWISTCLNMIKEHVLITFKKKNLDMIKNKEGYQSFVIRFPRRNDGTHSGLNFKSQENLTWLSHRYFLTVSPFPNSVRVCESESEVCWLSNSAGAVRVLTSAGNELLVDIRAKEFCAYVYEACCIAYRCLWMTERVNMSKYLSCLSWHRQIMMLTLYETLQAENKDIIKCPMLKIVQ